MKNIVTKLAILFFLAAIPFTAQAATTISKEDLKDQLESADLLLLDARSGRDWSASDLKIKGAIRASAKDFSTWSTIYPKDKTIVLYCA